MSKILLVQPALPLLAVLVLGCDPADRTACVHRVDVLRDPVHNGEPVAERHLSGRPHRHDHNRQLLLHGSQGNGRVHQPAHQRIHCQQSD